MMDMLQKLLVLAMCLLMAAAFADVPPAPVPNVDVPTQGAWGDQGDGTYANPVIPADFSGH